MVAVSFNRLVFVFFRLFIVVAYPHNDDDTVRGWIRGFFDTQPFCSHVRSHTHSSLSLFFMFYCWNSVMTPIQIAIPNIILALVDEISTTYKRRGGGFRGRHSCTYQSFANTGRELVTHTHKLPAAATAAAAVSV